MVPAFMRVSFRVALVLAAAAVVLGKKEDKDGRYGTDCTTVRMVVTNNAKYDTGFGVFKYVRLDSGASTQDCASECQAVEECRAFNYDKLSKWCYMGIDVVPDELDSVTDSKWACGFKDDCPNWLKPSSPPAVYNCNSYRMLIINNGWLLKGRVVETSTLAISENQATCVAKCSNNPLCYAFNYLKAEKFCALIGDEFEQLTLKTNYKWSSGYKWGCRSTRPPPPPSPPPPSPPFPPPAPPLPNYNVVITNVTTNSSSVAITFLAAEFDVSTGYQGVCIFMTGSCPTTTTGDVRSILATSSATVTVSGLAPGNKYTCFVQTQKGTDVLACSAGFTFTTPFSR